MEREIKKLVDLIGRLENALEEIDGILYFLEEDTNSKEECEKKFNFFQDRIEKILKIRSRKENELILLIEENYGDARL